MNRFLMTAATLTLVTAVGHAQTRSGVKVEPASTISPVPEPRWDSTHGYSTMRSSTRAAPSFQTQRCD